MRRYRLWLLALALGGCYSPSRPMCSYQCGTDGLCPRDYVCFPDGYCHLEGTTGECNFPPLPDLSGTTSDAGDAGTGD
jgi:hypothetical protein